MGSEAPRRDPPGSDGIAVVAARHDWAAPRRVALRRLGSTTKERWMINLLWIWLLAAPILLAGLSLVGTNR